MVSESENFFLIKQMLPDNSFFTLRLNDFRHRFGSTSHRIMLNNVSDLVLQRKKKKAHNTRTYAYRYSKHNEVLE